MVIKPSASVHLPGDKSPFRSPSWELLLQAARHGHAPALLQFWGIYLNAGTLCPMSSLLHDRFSYPLALQPEWCSNKAIAESPDHRFDEGWSFRGLREAT